MLKQVSSPLIGEAPSAELTDKITEIVTQSDIVYGVHDLVINNYGANRVFASVDAEVDANADIFSIHKAIDSAEKKILNELNVNICIHMDPVDKSDKENEKYRSSVEKIIKNYNSTFTFHDFMMVKDGAKVKITFDLLIPFDENHDKEKIKSELGSRLASAFSRAVFDFNIEHSYISEK